MKFRIACVLTFVVLWCSYVGVVLVVGSGSALTLLLLCLLFGLIPVAVLWYAAIVLIAKHCPDDWLNV